MTAATSRQVGGPVVLVVAVVAGLALVLAGPAGRKGQPPATGRVSAAVAWPKAARADLDPAMADGPLFNPLLFLDTGTTVGTAPTPDARSLRLLIRAADGGIRTLRTLPLDANPQFEAVVAADGRIIWTESSDRQPEVRIWTAALAGGPARLLTADTGKVLFFGVEADLTVLDGRLYWAAAQGSDTEIRSVALGSRPVGSGRPVDSGAVNVRVEVGLWALAGGVWLADQEERRLRNTATRRDTPVVTDGPETAVCGPVWCRVTGTGRIDLMHPDGSDRRRIAGGDARAAITDAVVLDRFALLDEPGAGGDLTGTSTLLVYDTATGRTVEVADGADSVFAGGGLVWWSTGADGDEIRWHVVDLRTV